MILEIRITVTIIHDYPYLFGFAPAAYEILSTNLELLAPMAMTPLFCMYYYEFICF